MARFGDMMSGAAIAAGSILLAMAAAPGISAPQTIRVLEAERFVLRDDTGRERAAIEMGRFGPRLALLDASGKLRAALELGVVAQLAMYDAAGVKRVAVSGVPDPLLERSPTGNGITLYEPDGSVGATLSLASRPALAMFHEKKRRIFLGMLAGPQLAIGEDVQRDRTVVGEGSVALLHPAGQTVGIFGAAGDSAGVILKNRSGRTVWAAP